MDTALADLPDKLYFRISEVASLVGVDAHVLRYWESEFKIKPHRNSADHRMYRKQDLARFLRIRRLLHEEGYTIAGARKVLSSSPGRVSGASLDQLRGALEAIEDLRNRIRVLRDEMDPKLDPDLFPQGAD